MKNDENRKIAALIVIAICVGTIAIASYMLPTDSFAKSKLYTEPIGNFSFSVPQDYDLSRQLIGENQSFVKITAPNDTNPANPGLGSVTVFSDVEGQSFSEQAAAYLSVDEAQMVPFASLKESLAYVEQRGQEASYYYFFKNQGKILVFKFNKRYFDKSNPMLLIDNSGYLNTFLRTLNSLKFD